MKKLIVIADWVDDSLTCQEFRSAIEGYVLNPTDHNVTFVSSTPSTIHTAFLASQVVQTEEKYGRPLDSVMFLNTDPRLQTSESSHGAKGAEFIVARLAAGMYVCGPNAEYVFSLIKDKIEELFIYRDLDKGSQFRSRDLYTRVCAHLMDSLQDELDLEEISKDYIAEFSDIRVGHIDNYGNIKTTATVDSLKGKHEFGDEITISMNNVTLKALYVENLFGGNLGELVLYPGSSGKTEDPYLEISIWRHFTEEHPTTGVHAFHHPRPGMMIELK